MSSSAKVELIKRHLTVLEALGVLPTVGQTSGSQGGRPTEAFWLNKPQAIFITTQSGTVKAVEITVEVVRKFDEYERGAIQAPKPAIPNFSNPAEAARAWADQYEKNLIAQEKVKALEVKTEELTEENDAMGAVLGAHDHRLTHFIRTLDGVNTVAFLLG